MHGCWPPEVARLQRQRLHLTWGVGHAGHEAGTVLTKQVVRAKAWVQVASEIGSRRHSAWSGNQGVPDVVEWGSGTLHSAACLSLRPSDDGQQQDLTRPRGTPDFDVG